MKVKELRSILNQANGEMDVYIQDASNREYEIYSITARERVAGDSPYLSIWQLYGNTRQQTGNDTNRFYIYGEKIEPLPEPPLPPHAKIMTHIPDDAIPDKDPFA